MATDERGTSEAATAGSGESWADVLAAVEADMVRTQQLMATSAKSVRAIETTGVPAQAMLPASFRQYSDATWATLPALEDMPAVPVELGERIHGLRAQIVALQAEIKAEMTQWQAECASRRAPAAGTPLAEPHYVDRLA